MTTVSCGFQSPGDLSLYGPTVSVLIGFDRFYRPDGPALPVLPPERLPALVDTGASVSSIDDSLAQRLRLPLVDTGTVSGVGGNTPVNIYLAQIFIPDLTFTIYGQFAGVLLSQGDQPHQALIGRTFL